MNLLGSEWEAKNSAGKIIRSWLRKRESKIAAIEVFDGRQDCFDCDLAAGASFSLRGFEGGDGL